VDVFEVNAVDLVNITQVIIGHDEEDAGHGWFLHKVCIRVANDDSAGCYWMFACDRYTVHVITVNCSCIFERFMYMFLLFCRCYFSLLSVWSKLVRR